MVFCWFAWFWLVSGLVGFSCSDLRELREKETKFNSLPELSFSLVYMNKFSQKYFNFTEQFLVYPPINVIKRSISFRKQNIFTKLKVQTF